MSQVRISRPTTPNPFLQKRRDIYQNGGTANPAMAQARIFKPAKTAMQSGRRQTRKWVLENEPATGRRPDPLMGWTSAATR